MDFVHNHRTLIKILICICFAASLIWYFHAAFSERDRLMSIYNQGVELIDNKQYQEGIEKLSPLGDYQQSLKYIDEAENALRQKELEKELAEKQLVYDRAMALYVHQQYDAAMQLFETLGDYLDSAKYAARAKEYVTFQQQGEKNYLLAQELYTSRDYDEALEVFQSLGDYKDSPKYVSLCELAIKRLALSTTISAGTRASAALVSEDGTARVKVAGNLFHGKSAIEAWDDIVSISVGGEYAIGLTSNGTVYTASEAKQPEYHFDMSALEDIMAVSAGEKYVVCLKSDGTLTAQGHNGDGQCNVDTWTRIKAIATGCRHTVGLNEDGELYITGIGASLQRKHIASHQDEWQEIVAISAGGGQAGDHIHTVALKKDGTVVAFCNQAGANRCDVSGWKNIIAVAAGNTFIAGLTDENKVVLTGNSRNMDDYKNWENIVAISAGTESLLGLTMTGQLKHDGYTKQGQGDVDNWYDVIKHNN